MVSGFELCGREVADRLQQATVIEPVDPLEGRELDVVIPLHGPRRRISSVL